MRWSSWVVLLATLGACDQTTASDAGAFDGGDDTGSADTGFADTGFADTGTADAATDGAVPGDSGADAGPCPGPCASTDLTATFGEVTERFDRVQFGFTTTGDGVMALYLEAHGGGSPDCPTMTSPSPDRTLVMNALPVLAEDPFTDFTANLLDFEGTLTMAPILPSTAASYLTVSTSLTPVDGAFVAFDLEATYDGGTIRGHGYATYCESLSDP